MTDFTNYYEVHVTKAHAGAVAMLEHIDNVVLPLAEECLKREKQDAAHRLFRQRAFGLSWHLFYRWFTTRSKLMIYCMDHPEEILGPFEGWSCSSEIRWINRIRGTIENVAKNTQREEGTEMLMKQGTHFWIFGEGRKEDLIADLDPWATEVENEDSEHD